MQNRMNHWRFGGWKFARISDPWKFEIHLNHSNCWNFFSEKHCGLFALCILQQWLIAAYACHLYIHKTHFSGEIWLKKAHVRFWEYSHCHSAGFAAQTECLVRKWHPVCHLDGRYQQSRRMLNSRCCEEFLSVSSSVEMHRNSERLPMALLGHRLCDRSHC